eukprot:2128339-Karenia_brevis.AAC.1
MSEKSLPLSSIDVRVGKDDTYQYEGFEFPQYPTNLVAEPNSPDQAVDFEDQMMKMVSITVKQIMGELVPNL